MSRVGQLIATRYLLLQLLDQGAMGEVYGARDIRLNTIVAVKFLKQALHRPEMCDRFLREAIVCAQLSLNSQHIVRVTDFGTDADNIPFLVMEYLQGLSLKQYLQARSLPLPQCLKWLEQICLGLKCAHDGIEWEPKQPRDPVIHCDLKPSNIFVSPDETLGERLKILDFGVAQLFKADVQRSEFAGTLPYCSPEQMKGKRLDPRSDIYSLGILMFELLTRQRPFQTHTDQFGVWYKLHCEQRPPELVDFMPSETVPPSLNKLVMACLEKSPQDRPQAIAEVLGVIRSLQENRPPATGPLPSDVLTGSQPTVIDLAALRTTAEKPPVLVFPPALAQHHILCMPVTQPVTTPALWVKLPHEWIQSIQIYRLYNETRQYFKFCEQPQYPAMLWATAIGNPQLGVRWFTCFLDLTQKPGRNIVFLLGQRATYQYLFFESTSPHWLAHQMQCQLKPEDQQEIQKAAIACLQPSIGSFQTSQRFLRDWFDQHKAAIAHQMLVNIHNR